MKHLPELDFALDRARRARQRKGLIAAIALVFGLQVGAAVWRWQSLQDARTELTLKQRQLARQGARSDVAPLSADQIKVATSVQAMLNALAIPWDVVLQAIESARPPRLVVESIQPSVADGSVNISVSSPDFAGVAAFVQALMQQQVLHGVMLASEALPDSGGAALRAVIHANWQSAP